MIILQKKGIRPQKCLDFLCRNVCKNHQDLQQRTHFSHFSPPNKKVTFYFQGSENLGGETTLKNMLPLSNWIIFPGVKFQEKIHPRNLTWKLKISPWKRKVHLETIIFRFHVKFRGCRFETTTQEQSCSRNPPPMFRSPFQLGIPNTRCPHHCDAAPAQR